MTMKTVVNPFDLSEIGSVPTAEWDEIDAFLTRAHELSEDRSAWMKAHERAAILHRAMEIMKERRDHLAFQIANEGGKPLIDARVEADRAINGMELCIHEIGALKGTEIPMGLTSAGDGRLAWTTREPIGPVVAVSAFNHPLNLIVHQVAPAVAVGCPVIVKPASDTPLSCFEFIDILHEAGLPKEWAKAVAPSRDASEKMVTDPRVAFFTFIGSAGVGWSLRSKLSPGTRCALEHGGVAPVIVDQTADLEAAVPSLAKGGFYHSGQVCVSVQRVFAHSSIVDELAGKLADAAKALKVGNAIEEDVECGPLIRPAEVDRVAQWVEEARDGGGTVLCGGERLSETTYAPTVLLNPPADATISRKEVFGPVVCVYSYDNVDDAIARANSLDVSFQAAVFTNDLNAAMHTYRNINASAVMVNDHTAFRTDWMPFTGLKTSGHGTGGIPYTCHEMTIEKMIVIKG
ncbi:aldehyde dehydrogenase family protein [Altererythrobacter rubellus]|uniref:Aldehyde dehydrogenase family protein n=1 Tax=Altererythrobacter rubellus TaxID=2173831 RepID=A0A9Y2BA40_9SPHN|nr:aldehyde dehydrogenase family protein [Altererythrobacter rubellus]WIW95795.1 aldehyde dehydrogenase family protein [Altererythrobacter rubellus]